MKLDVPDLKHLDGIVASRILDAMRIIAAEYCRLGVRHALVGGLAVGANGWPRATGDVDFLVDASAFEHREGGLVLLKVPFQAAGVPVDSILPADDEPFLAEARDSAPSCDGIPVLAVDALMYMKLKAGRMRDKVDVVELLKRGADPVACRAWLAKHAPTLLESFDHLATEAEREADV